MQQQQQQYPPHPPPSLYKQIMKRLHNHRFASVLQQQPQSQQQRHLYGSVCVALLIFLYAPTLCFGRGYAAAVWLSPWRGWMLAWSSLLRIGIIPALPICTILFVVLQAWDDASVQQQQQQNSPPLYSVYHWRGASSSTQQQEQKQEHHSSDEEECGQEEASILGGESSLPRGVYHNNDNMSSYGPQPRTRRWSFSRLFLHTLIEYESVAYLFVVGMAINPLFTFPLLLLLPFSKQLRAVLPRFSSNNHNNTKKQQKQPPARTFLGGSWLHRALFATCLLESIILMAYLLSMMYPSRVWFPFQYGRYQAWSPNRSLQAVHSLCLDQVLNHNGHNSHAMNTPPLCLSEAQWKDLSSGALSSWNRADVEAVQRGIVYAHNQSGGLVVNVMCRNCRDNLNALRRNVDSLAPFFPKLVVVVFENDSADGSRAFFQAWSDQATNTLSYDVDLMECPEAKDCLLKQTHRYDSKSAKGFQETSMIGPMAEFRQRLVDHVVADTRYQDFSHMLVLDSDLEVSISPLGILHTLGVLPDNPVATTGHFPMYLSMGGSVAPYDAVAYRVQETPQNAVLRKVHHDFCAQGSGRFQHYCDVLATSQGYMLRAIDYGPVLYKVLSAYNGAALYPMKAIRKEGVRYSTDEAGQMCEHLGLHKTMEEQMYINRKWEMTLRLDRPGGPSGGSAIHVMGGYLSQVWLHCKVVIPSLVVGAAFVWSTLVTLKFLLVASKQVRGVAPKKRPKASATAARFIIESVEFQERSAIPGRRKDATRGLLG